jgi:hypothetical protein
MTSTALLPATPTADPVDLIREVMRLERTTWPAHRARIRELGHPTNVFDGDGDGDGDTGGDGDGDGDDGSGDGDGGGGGDTGGDGDGDGDGDGEETVSKADLEKLQRRLAEESRLRRKAEQKLGQRERTKAEEDGEFERLYNEEKAAHEQTKTQIKERDLDRAVETAARKQNFRNPALVRSLIDLADDVEPDDERDIEKAVKALAKKEPYLVKAERPQSGSAGRGDDATAARQARRNGTGGDGDSENGDQKFGVARLRDYHASRAADD